MIRDEFETELTRLAAVMPSLSKPGAKAVNALLVEELWRRHYKLPALIWREMVTWVIDHHDRSGPPRPLDFEKGRQAIRAVSGEKQGPKCNGCGGDAWVRTYVWHERLGSCYEAVKPCPLCNRILHEPNPAVEEISRERYEEWAGIEKAKRAMTRLMALPVAEGESEIAPQSPDDIPFGA